MASGKPERRFSAAALKSLAIEILAAIGTPSDLAEIVSNSLVQANLAGHDSHGVLRLASYVERVRSGRVIPKARARIDGRSGATARIDGAWGWGQPAAHLAVDHALSLARDFGIAAVSIRRCNHIGRLGEYVERMASQGMLGFSVCNALPVVAPFGGSGRLLGTNPLAFAAPRSNESSPIMLDVATAAVAEGKLMVARAKREQVRLGLIVDREGRPTQEPEDYFGGGALLPFGGHKGYGLSVMVELLGGVLSGTGASSSPNYAKGNGTMMIAINIDAFLPVSTFISECETLSATIKKSIPADGFREVLLPGEPEAITRLDRERSGIPLPDETWSTLSALSSQLGVSADVLTGASE